MIAAVVLRKLLLDDVGLDGHAEVIGLTGEVGRDVIVLVLLERGIAQVAPQHRRQPLIVRHGECLADLDDLAPALLRPEVDRGADRRRAHVHRLLHRPEQDLVELVGNREQLVVVDLDDERNLVGVLPGADAQDAERRGHGVAAAFDRQPHDVLGIEVIRVLREAGAGRMLDALIHRQDREVPRAGQPPGTVRAAAD